MILSTNESDTNNFEVTMNMEHTNAIFTHRVFTLRITSFKQHPILNATSSLSLSTVKNLI